MFGEDPSEILIVLFTFNGIECIMFVQRYNLNVATCQELTA